MTALVKYLFHMFIERQHLGNSQADFFHFQNKSSFKKVNHDLQAYPCKFDIRDHARNPGPPKKSSKSELLMLNF